MFNKIESWRRNINIYEISRNVYRGKEVYRKIFNNTFVAVLVIHKTTRYLFLLNAPLLAWFNLNDGSIK